MYATFYQGVLVCMYGMYGMYVCMYICMYLSSMRMDKIHDISNLLFEHSVCGWVRNL